jgi:hypothetical protein
MFSSLYKKSKKSNLYKLIHFIEYNSKDPYVNHYNDYSYKFGSCSKFGKKNLVTGKIEYDQALICRNDENKCGIYDKFFIEKK